MRIGLVIPRFGDDVVGGAELHARWLAERLAHRHTIDVLTTCALDNHTWANVLPRGVEDRGTYRVRRFPVTDRDPGIHGELDRAIGLGFELSADEELLWLRHGVSSVEMEDELAGTDDFDLVLAMPYLYGTTYFAYRARPELVGLIPCLHDEPFAQLGFVAEMLRGARVLLFNTEATRELGRRIAGTLAPSGVVGVGLESLSGQPRPTADGPPQILYVGRREPGKNTPALIEHFCRYRDDGGLASTLVFAGGGDPVPRRDDVREITPDWDDAWSVYGPASVLCQPSLNESLSIVILQAWLAGKPVIVHGACDVTREHCRASNGGLWFTDHAEFCEVTDALLGSPELRERLGSSGQAYVRREYSWSAVVDRFESTVGLVV